ncbi:hypothetical protein [Pontiella sulfatireligans]|uniref:Uncharacterized protein n=1 Tax=Pontiella sulfatireligans TaxID=2750658 RepID=A0A6C2UPL2_9BACT|nr:hypothetical protein [Pontiella sulfatireligans]VGO22215.1 hypothetical protein SCARR_04297 [Pontiella sulfatireligans]
MCTEPDFDLPESFIKAMRRLEAGEVDAELRVKLAPDTEALVQKIAEQTGLPAGTAASALLAEGIAAYRSKGILF